MTIAIYPGSFDPITNGHFDIATRAAGLFEKLVIAVYESPPIKNVLFTPEERVDLVRQSIVNLPNVEVQSFTELTVDFARRVGAQVMVRGLRMSGDFEREFEMALMNKKLYPKLELVCLMEAWNISSSAQVCSRKQLAWVVILIISSPNRWLRL